MARGKLTLLYGRGSDKLARIFPWFLADRRLHATGMELFAVSKVKKTLDRVLRGNADANIRFEDLCNLLTHLGFAERVRGDHHIFTREGVVEILNLQPRSGKAKPYQVRQVRSVLTSYGLAGEPEAEEAAEEASNEEAGPTGTEENDGEQHQV